MMYDLYLLGILESGLAASYYVRLVVCELQGFVNSYDDRYGSFLSVLKSKKASQIRVPNKILAK